MKEIIVNENIDNERNIILIEDGIAVEIYEENKNSKVIEGDIYFGIVKNILPSMQVAFVDIGDEKNTFMHIKDIIPKVSNQTGNKEEKLGKYNIENYIKENTPILVQIKKEIEDKKGAKVSKHINLTGRYTVVLPGVDFVTISNKIEEGEKKNKLEKITKEILNEINTDNEKYGVILRTSSINAKKEDIEKDIKELIVEWKKIQSKYNKAKKIGTPGIISKKNSITKKLILGVVDADLEKITVNTEKAYKKIESILENLNIEKSTIELNIDKNVMEHYDLEKQLEKSKQRKIWLNCGGFITIDKTEALTAVDVNSGKFIGKKTNTKNDTIYIVNKEATVEIAKQLRLRNISGIIVIDYIDIEKENDRTQILNILDKELKKDRSKTQVIGFTKLDLLEMTRKKL